MLPEASKLDLLTMGDPIQCKHNRQAIQYSVYLVIDASLNSFRLQKPQVGSVLLLCQLLELEFNVGFSLLIAKNIFVIYNNAKQRHTVSGCPVTHKRRALIGPLSQGKGSSILR